MSDRKWRETNNDNEAAAAAAAADASTTTGDASGRSRRRRARPQGGDTAHGHLRHGRRVHEEVEATDQVLRRPRPPGARVARQPLLFPATALARAPARERRREAPGCRRAAHHELDRRRADQRAAAGGLPRGGAAVDAAEPRNLRLPRVDVVAEAVRGKRPRSRRATGAPEGPRGHPPAGDDVGAADGDSAIWRRRVRHSRRV